MTRHLAAFLGGAGVEKIDAILFNGGFFIPRICRDRVTDVVEKWYGARPAVFENQDLDLAVAVGAVRTRERLYLDVLVVTSLLGFLGTTIVARFIERRGS